MGGKHASTGRSAALLVAVLSLLACAPKPPPVQTPAEQREADLAVLVERFVEGECGMTPETRSLFEARVETLWARRGGLTDAEFALGVQRAVAAVDNAHSEVNLGRAFDLRLPLTLRWFDDGLHVVGAPTDQADLLGGRVLRLGAARPEALLAELDRALGGNRGHARVLAETLLVMPELLQALGALEDPSVVSLSLALPGDRRLTRSLEALPRAAAAAEDRITQLESVSLLPLYLRAPEESALLDWLDPVDAAYIRINRNDDRRLPERLETVVAQVAQRKPRHAIVDLRLNRGGDYTLTAAFARALPALIPPDGRIVLLLGPRSFSAAIVTAAILRQSAGARALIAGQPAGDGLRFWSEGGTFALPYSGLEVHFADGYHDWAGGTDLSDPRYRCNQDNARRNQRHSAAAGSLAPTITVPMTAADYAVGRDPLMPEVLRALRAER